MITMHTSESVNHHRDVIDIAMRKYKFPNISFLLMLFAPHLCLKMSFYEPLLSNCIYYSNDNVCLQYLISI